VEMTLAEARLLLRLAEDGRERASLGSPERETAKRVLSKLRDTVFELKAEDRLGEAQMELRRALHRLWLLAGEPSTRQMSRQIVMPDGETRSNMTWHYALRVDPLPPLNTLRALVLYLDGDLGQFEDMWWRAKGVGGERP
jgi:hypothetical protein